MLPWGNAPQISIAKDTRWWWRSYSRYVLMFSLHPWKKKKPCSVESHAHPHIFIRTWAFRTDAQSSWVWQKWIRRVKKKKYFQPFFSKLQMFSAFTDRKTYAPLRILEGFFVTLRKDNKGRSLLAISVVRMPRNVRSHPFFLGWSLTACYGVTPLEV